MRAITALLSLSAAVFAQSGYRVTKKIAVGDEGGWDYLMVDAASRRVYVSHASEVVVIDADTGEIAGKITGLKGVHGIAIAPKLGRGFISNGQADTITIFDTKTLARIGDEVPAGKNPDAIIFDPASNHVFAFNGRSSDATAVDAKTGKVAGTVPLEGKPEFAAADDKGNVYVNIEDKAEVIRIDSKKLTAGDKWPLAPCEEPSGMSMDTKTRRIFSGCHNKMMAVMNADTGKLVTTVEICSGIDATHFDPSTKLIYNSCGDGTITVIHEESADRYKVVETIKTQRGARTMAIDTKTHKIFTPVVEYEPAQPSPDGKPVRPKMVAGSFAVLVLEK